VREGRKKESPPRGLLKRLLVQRTGRGSRRTHPSPQTFPLTFQEKLVTSTSHPKWWECGDAASLMGSPSNLPPSRTTESRFTGPKTRDLYKKRTSRGQINKETLIWNGKKTGVYQRGSRRHPVGQQGDSFAVDQEGVPFPASGGAPGTHSGRGVGVLGVRALPI